MPRVKSTLKILHLDIETAPTNCYTWSLFPNRINIGDIVEPGYTLCWAAMWEGERNVQFSSIYRDGEEQMVSKVHALLEEADAVVHYYGTNFDIPTLNREFIKLGLEPPSHYYQIDLIKVVRKNFKFASNKLDFVCQQLGLGAKTHHKGMELWHKCMDRNPRAWKTMERYNKQDVKLLHRLYHKLLPWIHIHPNVGLYRDDPTRPTCSTCGSTNVVAKGTQFNARAASYKRWKCNSCGTPLRSRNKLNKNNENVLVRTP